MIKLTAIIPLRAGSKRIPGKNTKLLGGKSLFTYTLDEALKSNMVDIIISTDDKKVIEICNNDYKNYLENGKIKILERDKNLSNDTASSIDVILDVLDKNNYIENFVLLQATSPFRTYNSINKAIEIFKQNDSNSVISVYQTKEYPYWQHKMNKYGFLEPLMGLEFYNTRSQDLPKTYMENGAILVSNSDKFGKNKGFYTNKSKPIILNEIEAIDIDEMIDFEYCEFLLTNNKIGNLNKI